MLRTAKHQALVDDPVIRYKSVEALPGIGPVYGRRLRDAGYDTADKVLQQYLVLNRNENRFTSWLSAVCGVNSRFAAQCFSGLNEWYYTWGKEAKIPAIKKAKSASPLPSPLTNRMLLEHKMLRFNFNSSDERLRSLTQCQTMSLLDISRPQRVLMQNLNKSNLNISNGFAFAPDAKKMEYNQCHSLSSLMGPVQKSVNFKENEIIDSQTPRKFDISASPKRTISPILKTRSLTPENKMSAYANKKGSRKNLNIPTKVSQVETRNAPKKLNNLNSKFNTYTKKVPVNNSITIRKMTADNKVKNKMSNLKSDQDNSSSNRHLSSQNIEKYFDEAINVDERPKKSAQTRGDRQDSFTPDSLCSCDFRFEDSAIDVTTDSQVITTTEDDGESIGTQLDSSLTESNEALPREILPIMQDHEPCQENTLTDSFDVLKINKENDNKKNAENSRTSSESNFDNSNEDSGLDINTNGLIEFPNESEASEDESLTPFENIDSLSESSSDKTYEVNETTDAESAFNFVASTPTASATEAINDRTNDNDQTEHFASSTDDAKKTNVRLFCDMLSSDLEQLPTDKFRKLKLKILQMVYAELDECGLK